MAYHTLFIIIKIILKTQHTPFQNYRDLHVKIGCEVTEVKLIGCQVTDRFRLGSQVTHNRNINVIKFTYQLGIKKQLPIDYICTVQVQTFCVFIKC